MSTAINSEKPELMTKSEVAALFRVGTTTIDLWCRKGKLPPGRKLGRGRRWDAREIRRLAGLADTAAATDPQ